MGCSQSRLCSGAATQSQQAQGERPARAGKSRHRPAVRRFAADAAKTAESAELKAAATAEAAALLARNAGKSWRDTYVRATLVSYGASCRVFTAVDKHTRASVAIKTISKSQRHPELQRGRVLMELGAMLRLQHHPHAVTLLDAYEDARAYQLVMPLLRGGELFEYVARRQAGLTEASAAAIARSLLQYLAHIHNYGVAHMDIKPENIMFDTQGADGVLKVIDLGSAEFVALGQEVPHAFGTVRYCSPEMAAHSAGPASDVWSAGVLLCQVLTGRVPFLKDSDLDTLKLLAQGPEVKFSGPAWKHVSAAAKDCIQAMLAPDPEDRPSAASLLAHPWLAAAAPQTALGPGILQQLQLFASLSRARRVLLGVAAKSITGSEASRLLRQFLSWDRDCNGSLDFQELASAAQQAAPDLSDEALRGLFAALDVDETGSVDAQEFFAGVLQAALQPQQTRSLLEASFKSLDRQAKGHITKADLAEGLRIASPSAFEALHSSGSLESELAEVFADMDANGDGVVTLDEFRTALSSTGSLPPGPPPPSGPPPPGGAQQQQQARALHRR